MLVDHELLENMPNLVWIWLKEFVEQTHPIECQLANAVVYLETWNLGIIRSHSYTSNLRYFPKDTFWRNPWVCPIRTRELLESVTLEILRFAVWCAVSGHLSVPNNPSLNSEMSRGSIFCDA